MENMMKDRRSWVTCLKTVRNWSTYLNTDWKDQMGLQIGLMDQYAELLILSKILDRKIPAWVKEKI